jgi:hypothetical protein
MLRAALGLWFCLLAAPSAAQQRVAVRTGDHPTYGRIVFDWAAPPAYQVEQQGERVILRFPNADAIDLAGAHRLPRNVLAVARVPGGVELTLRPGARIRHFRNGPKVALDVLDPSETREAEASPTSRRPGLEVAATRPNAARAQAPLAARPAPAPPVAAAPVATPPVVPAPAVLTPLPAPPAVIPAVAVTPRPEQRAPTPASALMEAPAPARPEPVLSLAPSAAVAAPPEVLRPAPEAARPATRPQPPLTSLAGPPPIRARWVQEAELGPAMRLQLGAGTGVAAIFDTRPTLSDTRLCRSDAQLCRSGDEDRGGAQRVDSPVDPERRDG